MILQTCSYDIRLQELLQPDARSFACGTDISAMSAVLKVRQTLASGSAILTLTSPTNIDLGVDGTLTVNFTSAHFTTLLAGLTGDGVYDIILTPVSGATAMVASGPISCARTVSR